MNTNLKVANAEQIPIEGMDDAVVWASLYHLAVTSQIGFDIYVDGNEQDEITQAITGRTFSFPPGFTLLPDLIKPGQRVLDLGVYIGTFSLFAAALGYQVISVEASFRNATLLKKSVEKNGFNQVHIVRGTVCDHIGTLEFVQAGPYGFVSNPVLGGPTITVPAFTVDHLLHEVGWDSVGWIKMDVEGSEIATVQGMSKLLSRDDAPVILYESNGHTLNLFGKTPADLMGALEGFGYRCYLVEPGRLVPCQSGDFQPETCVDYVATKRALDVSNRWHIAPPMSFEERIAKILATSTHPHKFVRAYIARALVHADDTILSDLRVQNALDVLSVDAEADVQAAANWWPEHNPLSFQESAGLRRALLERQVEIAEKDAELDRLRNLVGGYERGRFIRMMNTLNRLRRKVQGNI